MADNGFTVDLDALRQVAKRFTDLAQSLPTLLTPPEPNIDLGQRSAPMFADAKDLGAHYATRAGKLHSNAPQVLAGQLNALANAAAVLARRYSDGALHDQVSAGDVNQLLNGSAMQTTTQTQPTNQTNGTGSS